MHYACSTCMHHSLHATQCLHAAQFVCSIMQCIIPLFCFSYSAEICWLGVTKLRNWTCEPDVSGQPGPIGGFTVNVDRGQVFQSIKGFGAALSNAAAYLLAYSNERENVLNELFGSSGIGLSYVGWSWVGRISRCLAVHVWWRLLRRFQYERIFHQQGSGVRHSSFEGHTSNQSSSENHGHALVRSCLDEGQRKSERGIFEIWCRVPESTGWIFCSIREGLSIARHQHRHHHSAERAGVLELGVPTMAMPWNVQRDLIRDHLGPRFRQEGITTEIIIWDHNWEAAWYPNSILADAGASQYIAGTAWHCYEGNRYDPLKVQALHPDKDVYFSECSGIPEGHKLRQRTWMEHSKSFHWTDTNWSQNRSSMEHRTWRELWTAKWCKRVFELSRCGPHTVPHSMNPMLRTWNIMFGAFCQICSPRIEKNYVNDLRRGWPWNGGLSETRWKSLSWS